MPPSLPPAPEPFVLLDDARSDDARASLYRDLVGEVTARRPEEIGPALAAIRAAGMRGLHAAGYLCYEAGHALEPVLARFAEPVSDDDPPLLWFGLFADCVRLTATDVSALLPQSDARGHGAARPTIDAQVHGRAVERVLDYIRAGDIYQANLTFAATVPITGDPLAVYAAVRPRAAMGHGALVRHDGRHILSFSPESFFAINGRAISTLPMKGTAARGSDPAADAQAAASLRADPKQRAENLMIVDLIRNDLSRVCAAGTVRVPDLFTVETYPTVHQMTSRVVGELREGVDAVDALAALFPCGSVTGAPKIRAMEIIAAVERRRRGAYTGSIGAIGPDGDARFNVAIRTISVEKGANSGFMGIGSGIVADSDPAAEWQECLDKARFLDAPKGTNDRGREG